MKELNDIEQEVGMMTDVKTQQETFVAEDAARDHERSAGLCTTCDHRSDCVFASAEIQPVVFCEEFTDSMAEHARDREQKKARVDGTSPVDPMLRGLCVNCDNREGCVHEKPAGGISYCEDYA